MKFLETLFSHYKRLKVNYSHLRRAVHSVARDFERLPIHELEALLENKGAAYDFEREIDNFHLHFTLQEWGADRDTGHPGFSITVSGLPTLLGIKPGYRFYKRPDGSVSH